MKIVFVLQNPRRVSGTFRSLWTLCWASLLYSMYLGIELLDYVCIFSSFLDNIKLFSKMIGTIFTPTKNIKKFLFSLHSHHSDMTWLLYFGQYDRYASVPHCSINWYCPTEHLSLCLLVICIFFHKVLKCFVQFFPQLFAFILVWRHPLCNMDSSVLFPFQNIFSFILLLSFYPGVYHPSL